MTRTGPAEPALLHYYRGRVALHAILRGLGARAGDEVVLAAYTCAAVVEPLRRLGVRPVYVDIDRRTCTMDLSLLPAALTARTRAVIVQHTFGVPVDLKRALAVTEPAGVPLVEDCAHDVVRHRDPLAVGVLVPGGNSVRTSERTQLLVHPVRMSVS